MFANGRVKRQMKNEKTLKKLHGEIWLSCSNEACPSEIKVREDEANRVYLCTKCQVGFLKRGRKKDGAK